MTEPLQRNKVSLVKGMSSCFELAKQHLMSSRIRVHSDPALPICLASDASPYGVRAVISPVMLNDLEKPVAFTWQTLVSVARAAARSKKLQQMYSDGASLHC